MRSFILTAAIAATLASIPITVSYGASLPGGHAASATGGHGASTTGGHHASAAGRHILSSSSDEGPQQGDPAPYMTDPITRPRYQPFSMTTPPIYRGGRLAVIESELGRAAHEINVDRRRGEITAREASFARREDRSVRAEAVNIARENGGRIPAASYAMLQDRVSDLDRTINRYAAHMTRG